MLSGALLLLVFLVAVLAIPLRLSYKLSWPEPFESDVRLQWAFGLLSLRVPAPKSPRTATKDEEHLEKPDRLRPSKLKSGNLLSVIRRKAFRQRLTVFGGDMWRAVHKRDVKLHLVIGLGDPADTGQLWALVGPMAGILATIQDTSIVIEPEFVDATIALDGSGTLRIIPLEIIYLIIGLLLSPPIWRGIREVRATGH